MSGAERAGIQPTYRDNRGRVVLGDLIVAIDGREIGRKEGWTGPVGRVALRPWRNRMTVAGFVVEGTLIERFILRRNQK